MTSKEEENMTKIYPFPEGMEVQKEVAEWLVVQEVDAYKEKTLQENEEETKTKNVTAALILTIGPIMKL